MANNILDRLDEIFESEDEMHDIVMHTEEDSSIHHDYDVHNLGNEFPDVVKILNKGQD